MKIASPWPWPQGHPWGGDDADKTLDLYLLSGQISMKSIKESSKYKVL